MASHSESVDFSRPYEAYEELDLNDDDNTQSKNTSPFSSSSNNNDFNTAHQHQHQHDPWQSSSRAQSYSSTFSQPSSSSVPPASSSRFSPSESVGSSSPITMTSGSGSVGGMPGVDTKGKAASRSGTSSGSVSGGKSRTSWDVPLVLGVAVVDFNHLIGPTVEFAHPPSLHAAINADDSLNRLLPFLALPDGAHLSEEDYSYFHCTYTPLTLDAETNVPTDQTLFGISCNRQLAASELLRRPSDVTRSMVQKAVVVIASKPVFGPIRDQLGVVTRAYFAQRDFTQTDILEDFYNSLEMTLEGKADESAIYMGTSLRELVHKFRHRTLVLLKMLMLQKRIMLFGYPVEMLCTYQYSLVSLIPGLLLSLNESGSPELDSRATRTRPTSLRTSDRGSLLRYMGLPLHLFGKDAFFQPYLPLQQVDMLKTGSWLVGTTNQIVTQQKDCKYDLLVNIENVTFEFSDPKMERVVGLTPADRRWMDDVVRTVEETWNTPEDQRANFRGSDDDLRSRFEEYICAALASIKYAEFVAKSKAADVSIVGNGNDANANSLASFGDQWLTAFKTTQAFRVWDACTDPVLFDLCEPRHPCDGKASVVSDLGLRLAEGIHDLKIDQHLSPTREVLSSAFAAGSSAFATGSTSLFKAFDGVRNDIATRMKEREEAERNRKDGGGPTSANPTLPSSSSNSGGAASINTTSSSSTPTGTPQMAEIRATLGGIGSGIGSFFGSRVASLRVGVASPPSTAEPVSGLSRAPVGSGPEGGKLGTERERNGTSAPGLRPMSLMGSSTTGRARTPSGPGGHL